MAEEKPVLFDALRRRVRRRGKDLEFSMVEVAILGLLALRRTDGSDGWVYAEELLRFIPRLPKESFRKTMSRIMQGTFGTYVHADNVSTGPFRLGTPVELFPSRESVWDLIRSLPGRGARSTKLTATELELFDTMAQRGFYPAAGIDHIVTRLGDPAKERNPRTRLQILKILITIEKNRRDTKKALGRIPGGGPKCPDPGPRSGRLDGSAP